MIVYRPKLVLKRMRYHKNTKTLIMSSLYFLGKLTVFYLTSHNKLYWLGKNWNERARPSWRARSKLIFAKRAQRYQLWIKRYEFSREDVKNFSTLCHLSSKRDILTTVASNQKRLELYETRHTKLFVYKTRRKRSLERPPNSCAKIGLEIKKDKKMLIRRMTWQIRMELALVYLHYCTMVH